jgi:parvulin-like peptidyl-prolyl isomerase
MMVVVLGLLALGLGAIDKESSRTPAAAPEVVATVEGKQIDARIFRMYLNNGIQSLGLSEATPEGRRQIELLKEGIVSELVDRALIETEARRRNIAISDEAFKSACDARIAQMGDSESYKAYLSEHAISDREFREVIRQELYGQLMQEELGKEVATTADELRAFYGKEKANPALSALFKESEQVRASHILIAARRSQIKSHLSDSGNASPAQLDRLVTEEMNRRRERAALLLSKARAGADFASLARAHSEDPGTRAAGGDLGFFTRDTHTRGFDTVAFALKPGQTSSIVETDYGFHIIRITGHKAERTRSFEEVRAALDQRLLARKRAEHLTRWLEARRREAAIQIDPNYRSVN